MQRAASLTNMAALNCDERYMERIMIPLSC